MRSNINTQAKTIEDKLEKKNKAKSGQVFIRELVGYQKIRQNAQEAMGEFYVTTPSIAQENRNQLLERIKSYILQLADIAKQQHLLDNFINPEKYLGPQRLEAIALTRAKTVSATPTDDEIAAQKAIIIAEEKYAYINPSKLNHVTRLSLSEFSLYPSQLQGPLTHAEFTQLLESLEPELRELPENLHLIAGSIPVMNANNEVRNIAIYLECGPKATIRPFAKAVNHYTDPTYPNTKNTDFVSTLPESAWSDQIHEGALDLIKNHFNVLPQLNQAQLNTLIVKLNKFKKLLQSNDGLKPTEECLANLKHIEECVRKKNIHLINTQHILAFQNHINQFKKSIDNYRIDQVKMITSAVVPANEKDGAIVMFAGKIKCTTAGDVRFDVYPEICLDHKHKEAFQRGIQEITATLESGNMVEEVPTCHVLLSNHIPINPANLVCDAAVQADPVHSVNKNSVSQSGKILRATSSKPLSAPSFASPVSIDIYPSRALSDINAQFKQVIANKKAFTKHLRALRILKWQQPARLENIDAEIIQHILTSLRHFLQGSKASILAPLEKSDITYQEAEDAINALINEADASIDNPVQRELLLAKKLLHAEKVDSERLQASLEPLALTSHESKRQYTGQNNAQPDYTSYSQSQFLKQRFSLFDSADKAQVGPTQNTANQGSPSAPVSWSNFFNEQALPLLQVEAIWLKRAYHTLSSLWHGTDRLTAQEAVAIRTEARALFGLISDINGKIGNIDDQTKRYDYFEHIYWYDHTISAVVADSHQRVRSKYQLGQLREELELIYNELTVDAKARASNG